MMGNQEIEKRFLVTELSPDFPISGGRPLAIRQGYIELASAIKSFRVRIINNSKVELAVKSGRGMIRVEEQYKEGGLALAEFVFTNLVDHELEKTRYRKDGWEIDIFKPPLEGIVLAEKEFASADEVPDHLELPDWIGKGIDVTDSLTNHHLARLATLLTGTNKKAIEVILKRLNPPIPKIVITGPPCSGKTKMILTVKGKMPEFHCVPEVATIVIQELGVRPGKDELSNKQFQEKLYKVQGIFEETSVEFALAEGKIGLIQDRGTVDNIGYFPGGLKAFEYHLKTTLKQEYGRYRGVACLQVAPPDVYEKEKTNNPARSETYDEACLLEKEMIKAWQGHPNFTFIPNGPSWDEKEKQVLEMIARLIP